MADNEQIIDDLMAELIKKDGSGDIVNSQELKENQFGFPLPHYAQQYLFGATGLRIQVFNSIAGKEATCKSPFLFDLMGLVAADKEHGGLGGMSFLFELEFKISPTLYFSMINSWGKRADKGSRIIKGKTLEEAFDFLNTQIIPAYRKIAPKNDVPILIGFDSIGGAASKDMTKKLEEDGSAGKGYGEKTHHMKNFCENMGKILGDIPMVIYMVNQVKDSLSANPYGAAQTHVTGGTSQLFRDGHMIQSKLKGTLASGDGKMLTMTTTKTSFSDSRKIEVGFHWNRHGQSQDDYYGHHWNWALASAKCLADPDKGVGDIRDICDVKISDKNLVTSEKLGLRSVTPEEFEAALFDPSNAAILDALYVYQKIDKLKTMEDYKEYLKAKKEAAKGKEQPAETPKITVAKRAPGKKKAGTKEPLPKPAPVSIEDAAQGGF